MSLRNILDKMSALSQQVSEDTVTNEGRVHFAPPGGYGRKFDTDEEGAEVTKAAPAVKKGRGRPKKGSDSETGEVKDFNGTELSKIMGLAGVKAKPGKGTRSNRLKEEDDEYTNTGALFPDTDDLDTYGGEHDPDPDYEGLDEESGVRSHRAGPGGYGRKFDTDEEGDEVAKKEPAVSRGRGRPRKGSDESGQVKDFNGSALAKIMGGSLPKDLKALNKKLPGTKHKLKDWIEHVESDMLAEAATIATASSGATPTADATGTQATQQNQQQKNNQQAELRKQQANLEKDEFAQLSNLATKAGLPADKVKQFAAKNTSELKNTRQQVNQQQPQGQQAVAEESVMEVAPPGMEGLVKSLKKQYPGQPEKAYSIAWAQYNKNHGRKTKSKGVTVRESRGELTLAKIIHAYPHEVRKLLETGEIDNDLYSALFDYYFERGEIPYGVAKARDGDPYEWIFQRFSQDYEDHEIQEGSFGQAAGDVAGTIAGRALGAPLGPVGSLAGGAIGGTLGGMAGDMLTGEDEELDEGLMSKLAVGAAVLAAIWGISVPKAEQAYVESPQVQQMVKLYQVAKDSDDYEAMKYYEQKLAQLKGKAHTQGLEEESLEHQLNSLANSVKFDDDSSLDVDSSASDVVGHMAQDELDEELDMNEDKKKWIQGAIKKPGSLHKQLGVPQDEKIPAGKLAAAAKKGGKLGKRARLAQTLEKMHESDEVMENWSSELESLLNEGTKVETPSTKTVVSEGAVGPEAALIKQLLARAGIAGGAEKEEGSTDFDGSTYDGTGFPSVTAKTPSGSSDPHKAVADGADEVPIMAMPRGMAFSANVEDPAAEITPPVDALEVIRDLSGEPHDECAPEGAYDDGDGEAILAFIKKMTGGDSTTGAAPSTTPGIYADSAPSSDYADEKTEYEVGEGEGSGTGATPAASPLTDNKPEKEVDESGIVAGTVAEDEAEEAGEAAEAEDEAQAAELDEDAVCEECGKGECECAMNESHTTLFTRLFKVFEAAESKSEEDDKAEKAGKKVAKDIEYDEGHKGKDDDKAERAGKKVTKDIEYDDKKDEKEKVDESLANSADNTVTTDADYMINTITAGLNGKKRNQTTVPQAEVEAAPKKQKVTNVSESAEGRYSYADELKALAGINYQYKGQTDVSGENIAEQMRKLAGIKNI